MAAKCLIATVDFCGLGNIVQGKGIVCKEPIEENIEICKTYLARMSKMGMTLEIELGITGGEEDGVDNSDVDSSKLYTQPSEVSYAYEG